MIRDKLYCNPQTLLFVPADRPDRFDKALASGAHLVCLDLEDAVAPQRKQLAREATLTYLDRCTSQDRLAVRINRVASREGLSDILCLCQAHTRPATLLLPKVESVAEIEIVVSALGSLEVGLIPLIESVKGLADVASIATASPCTAVLFGGHDFASELGVAMEWEPMLLARSTIAHACAAAGIPAIDAPSVAFEDEAQLEHDTRRAKALGFTAKAAIHPAQIAPIHRVFHPTDEEIAEARDAIEAFRFASGAAVQFRGRMLDKPMMRRYELTLARADLASGSQ